ncbi:MAG TPA: glycosyltransferase [Desulfobacteraceae bacterium]|nr:glycosyltransferase [Desulfobacteraceae bacterium]HPJ68075.1 glycosyltransferase [Desulfobacteraceae bacterium]HPQ28630.1 glycosyltransferase [Desulfobacteraceae bacterium]
MTIPKIIHQTHKTKNILQHYKTFQQNLVDLHPNWEYRFYDDQDCRKFVRQHFPSFIPLYSSYSENIQSIDLFRILVVYKEGGFYIDMDIDCFNNLDDLCEFNCVLGEEKRLTQEGAKKLNHKHTVRVANYMFGSSPNHPFLLRILHAMMIESQRAIKTENDVLESTGPGLITKLYFNWKDTYRDVVLLPNKDRICTKDPYHGVSCHFGNYARHFHDSSWRWEGNCAGEKNVPREKKKANQKQIIRLNEEIESSIKQMSTPENVNILKTYNEISYNGLSSVFHRTRKIGMLENDTRHLKKQKMLVCGIPGYYSDKLSSQNINVIYTFFEGSKLPDSWIEAINTRYHHCIVPHKHIKDTFKNSGIDIPIKVIHPGFTRYKRMRRNMNIEQVFRIGFSGGSFRRKSLDKLFKACLSLLQKIPTLKLAIHVSKYKNGADEYDMKGLKSAPFVEWSEGCLNEDEMAKWYHSLSCLVVSSGGTGWSFTPRESLYLGIPTIITDLPVHRELAESGYYKIIPTSDKQETECGDMFEKWRKIKTKDIENSILNAYQNYGNFQIQSLIGSKWIENKWSNESSQQRILNFLRSI